jgi:hypothetical protein
LAVSGDTDRAMEGSGEAGVGFVASASTEMLKRLLGVSVARVVAAAEDLGDLDPFSALAGDDGVVSFLLTLRGVGFSGSSSSDSESTRVRFRAAVVGSGVFRLPPVPFATFSGFLVSFFLLSVIVAMRSRFSIFSMLLIIN